jgi:23S rRNA (uracil1939-C5)-methyltransferase
MTQGSETMDLEITDLARGGAGVGRAADGRVVFVPLTAPGDLVRVRIVSAEKRYAHGELVELLKPSSVRQEPRCPAFGKCGGCQWQHLPYEVQWKTKVRGVTQALARAGIEPAKVEELPAERVWEYRNRIQLRGEGKQLGFYAVGSRALVPVDRCDIARPELNARWEALREQGSLLPREYKVEVEVQANGEVREAWNQGHAALGFRQVHDEQNCQLQQWVRSALAGHEGGIFDLFGGSGNLSLPLALEVPSREIHCVDVSVPGSEQVAANLFPSNLRFHRSPVLKWALRQKRLPGRWAAILDPPREGLGKDHGELAVALERLGVERIVAVGCDPDAWVRDVSKWVGRGWRLERAGILDLFPQTPHVESLALLVR